MKNIIDLTSRYSYVLYLYLEHNHFRKFWKVSLEELKKLLKCNAETYSQYKRFNDLVLKKCQKELTEKTNLRFSYYPTDKRGRSYKSLQFTVETVADQISAVECPHQCENNAEKKQYDGDYYGYPSFFEDKSKNYGGKLADLLGQVACENEFTPQQVRVIQDLILRIVGDDHMQCCNYLLQKMHLLNCYDVKNRCNYLIAMLNDEIKEFDSE